MIIHISTGLYIFVEHSLSRDLTNAQNTAVSDSFDTAYLILVVVISILNVINFFICGLYAFTTYICSINWADLIFTVNILNFFWIALTVAGIYALKNIQALF